MIWLGICSKGVFPLMIFEEGTVDHERYIQEVLPVTPKFGNDMFSNNWTFQQDGRRPHICLKTQKIGVGLIYHVSLTKTIGPQNSPDLNPLDQLYLG